MLLQEEMESEKWEQGGVGKLLTPSLAQTLTARLSLKGSLNTGKAARMALRYSCLRVNLRPKKDGELRLG